MILLASLDLGVGQLSPSKQTAVAIQSPDILHHQYCYSNVI